MSDNSFTNLTPSGTKPSEIPGTDRAPKESRVEIIRIPDDLKNRPNNDQQRLRGEVVRSDRENNRISVRTSRGDIDIQLPREHATPPRGTNVEIQLSHTTRAPAPSSTSQPNLSATLVTLPPTSSPRPAAPLPSDSLTLGQQAVTALKTYQAPLSAGGSPAAPSPPATSLQPLQTILLRPLSAAQLATVTIDFSAPPPTNITRLANNLLVAFPNALQGQSFAVGGLSVPAATTPTLSGASLFSGQASRSLFLSFTSTTSSPALASPLSIFSVSGASLTNAQTALNVSFSSPAGVSGPGAATLTQIIHTTTLSLNAGALHDLHTPQYLSPQKTREAFSLLKSPAAQISLNNLSQILSAHGIQTPQIDAAHLGAQVIGRIGASNSVIALLSPSASLSPPLFVLPNTTLPLGQTFSFPASQLQGMQSAQNITTGQSTRPALMTQGVWPALQEMLETLSSAQPQAAQNLMNMMANVRNPAQMTPAIFLFLAALKGGDIGAWMGEKQIEALKRLGKNDLLSRLTSDFLSLSRLSSDPLPQEWRGLNFPMLGEHNVQNIVIFYRQEENEDKPDNSAKQTRFIFDLDLSRMGNVQIDGLFKPSAVASRAEMPRLEMPRLEMIIRSEAAFSESMRQTLRQNYSGALKDIGIDGDLRFQDGAENFLTILEREEKVKLTT